MTPERWQRVEWLFDAVLSRPVAERAQLLDEATADDPALRREVDSLIRSLEAASRFIDTPAVDLRAAVDSEPVASGTRIGNYRVERLIGTGGVGQVYFATRADEAFEREVAIKLIKRGMDTDDLVRRFRGERQILAQLDHPNIADLIDGGATEDGRPYLVMEYVDGMPIDRWCDEQRLDVRDRLALFLTVCDAVHFAHRNFVVHRDLKPGNILVDRDGAPKLLDFGIAKLLDPQAMPGTIVPTTTGWRAMTPQYASPEQVRGEGITTASDVYALGVILYELLTGTRPYQVSSRSARAIEAAVCETEPQLASRTVGGTDRTRPLARQLRGDLDDILMMALEKEPAKRYASVDRLAADIRRHLEGRPVEARRSTWLYRSGKFVRRNVLGVGAAATLLVLLLAFLGTLLFQRGLTLQQRNRAEAALEFLVDIFEISDPSRQRGETVTARELLDRGARDIEAQLRDQPGLQGELLGTIGETFVKLGLYSEAEGHLERSLALTAASYGVRDPAIATAKQRLADLRIASDDYAEAERLTREALGMRRRRAGNEAAASVESLFRLAEIRHRRGAFAESDALFVEAGRLAHDGGHEELAVHILFRHGVLARYREHPEAEARLVAALARAERFWGDDHPEVALILTQLAEEAKLDDPDRAAAYIERALAIQRLVHGGAHPDLASTLNNKAVFDVGRGAFDAAEAGYREALAMVRVFFDRPSALEGIVLNNLARLRRTQGDTEGAIELYEASIAVHEAVFGAEHEETANVVNNLAVVLQKVGRLDEAESRLRATVDVLVESLGPRHSRVAVGYNNLGRLVRRRGEDEKAKLLFEHAVEILREISSTQPELSGVLQNLASILDRQGDSAGAEALYLEALAVLESTGREHSAEAAVLYNNLAVAKYLVEAWDESEAWARRAVEAYERLQAPGSGDRLRSQRILGLILQKQDRVAEAEAILVAALEVCGTTPTADAASCEEVETSLGRLREAKNE